MITSLPYPGLRPFSCDEADIFFGREDQTDELLRKLSGTRFLAIVGPSGCGKSSLARAGMIAALETGFMVDAGSRWSIAIMRPGSHPMKRLVEALMGDAVLGDQRQGEHAVPLLEATLRRGSLGMIEALQETPLTRDTNLLLVVDQFEELFRFRMSDNRDEQDAFMALLLETVLQREFPVYIVITMRSDYLGDCALFPGLPEMLNASQYLTPRMTREQRSEAIVGPARVFGGDVEARLLNRLLNESGADPNQLPVMQHLLMRMWRVANPAHVETGRETQPDGGLVSEGRLLGLDDYEKVGAFYGALSQHADEAYDSLTGDQKLLTEKIFRSLCERGKDSRDGRHPTSVRDIAGRAQVDLTAVIEVVDVFRSPAFGFIGPPPPEKIYGETMLDITHESIISHWRRLNRWVDQEAKSIETYQFLENSARRWKDGKAALWGSPNLEMARHWRENEEPGPVWASRHGEDFALAMEFFRASEEQFEKEERRKQKEQQRQLRNTQWLALGFGLLAILLGGANLLYAYLTSWDYTGYFNSFIKIDGEPRGIGALDDEQVKHRPFSFKITKKGRLGHVYRMEAVNWRGEHTSQHFADTYLNKYLDDLPEEVIWTYLYDESGRVIYEKAYNLLGKQVWGLQYSASGDGQGNKRSGRYVDAKGYPLKDKKYSQSFVEIERRDTPEGHEEYIRYRNRGDHPIRGQDKAFGQVKRYDANGWLVELASLGPDDQLMNDEFGNAILRIGQHDQFGNYTQEFSLDINGNLVVTTDGWAMRTTEFNAYGLNVGEAYLDADGKPTLHINGYQRVKLSRDIQGNTIGEEYFDVQGQPTVGSSGCYKLAWEYDDHNMVNSERCLDRDGNLMLNKMGFARWQGKWDRHRKNIVEESYHDLEDKLTPSTHGYSRALHRYDEAGRHLETRYMDVAGHLVAGKDGYAGFQRKYDGRGNLLGVAYFDTDSKPVASRQGYASWQQEYDFCGNIVRSHTVDVDGRRTVSADGVAGWKAKYDANGNQIEFANLSIHDKLMIDKDGIAGWRSEYDQFGNIVQLSYFGLNGGLTLNSDGVAGFHSCYDLLGNELEKRFFGIDGKPTRHKDGYAGWKAEYDAFGHMIEYACFDLDERPALVPWPENDKLKLPGYSSWRNTYNAQGKTTEEAYFGMNGEPVARPEGWARAATNYDSHGNPVETRYFGKKGEPVNINGGYHLVTRQYNAHGNIINVEYFDSQTRSIASNEGFARLVKRYDALGRLTEQVFYDANGKPGVILAGGFHKEVRQYHIGDLIAEQRYFGVLGEPVQQSNGYHLVCFAYDHLGNQIEQRFLGLNEEPVYSLEHKSSRIRFQYDPYGRVVETTYFVADPESASGYRQSSRVQFEFNIRGNKISEFWFDDTDGPLANMFGIAGRKWTYDEYGRLTGKLFFGADGKPRVPDNRSCASLVYMYDDAGNIIEKRCLGSDGALKAHRKGYARVVRTFDARQQMIEERYFGSDGSPATRLNTRQHMRRIVYDDDGKISEETYFDADGEPVTGISPNEELCLRWTAEYDRSNVLIGGTCHNE